MNCLAQCLGQSKLSARMNADTVMLAVVVEQVACPGSTAPQAPPELWDTRLVRNGLSERHHDLRGPGRES